MESLRALVALSLGNRSMIIPFILISALEPRGEDRAGMYDTAESGRRAINRGSSPLLDMPVICSCALGWKRRLSRTEATSVWDSARKRAFRDGRRTGWGSILPLELGMGRCDNTSSSTSVSRVCNPPSVTRKEEIGSKGSNLQCFSSRWVS